MIKDVLRQLDYSQCAQISLLMFFGIFVAVSIRALFSTRRNNIAYADVIFDEGLLTPVDRSDAAQNQEDLPTPESKPNRDTADSADPASESLAASSVEERILA